MKVLLLRLFKQRLCFHYDTLDTPPICQSTFCRHSIISSHARSLDRLKSCFDFQFLCTSLHIVSMQNIVSNSEREFKFKLIEIQWALRTFKKGSSILPDDSYSTVKLPQNSFQSLSCFQKSCRQLWTATKQWNALCWYMISQLAVAMNGHQYPLEEFRYLISIWNKLLASVEVIDRRVFS